MKYPINGDLEKHLLNGCRIINKQSLTYSAASGEITHILIECPKDYVLDFGEKRPVKFISLEYGIDFIIPSWYDCTYHYSTRLHSVKHFIASCREDRSMARRIKEIQNQQNH